MTNVYWPNALRSLRSWNLRVYFPAMLISLIGWWMQVTAVNWLTYRLTDSPLMLGLTNFIALLPVGLFAVLGGILVDRMSSRRLVLLIQLIAIVAAGGLTVLTATGLIQVWQVMILTFVAGSVNTIDASARIALIRDSVVDKQDLTNAVGLSLSLSSIARTVGPAVGGLAIERAGEVGSFLLNMLSYIAVILAVSVMRLTATKKHQHTPEHVGRSLIAGLKHLWHNRVARGLLGLSIAFGFLVQPFIIMLPVFVRDVLQVGPDAYGLLMGAFGLGAACGALGVASLREAHRGQWLVAISFAFPCFLVLYVLSPWVFLSMGFLFLAGACQMAQYTLIASLLQLHSADEFQGRAISVFFLVSNGFPRLGSVLAGAVLERASLLSTAAAASVLALLWLLYTLWRMPFVRRLR
jgi:predicted MFS family arabinose efflux permease